MKKIVISLIIVSALISIGFYLNQPFVQQTKTDYGYSLEPNIEKSNRVSQLRSYVSEHSGQFDALVINMGNKTLFESGEIDKPLLLASIRKSLLNLLIGIAVSKNLIDIDKSLADLRIDEPKHPLTAIEKTATIRDLMMSRSGIYIESAQETSKMKRERPERGAYRPGEHFYYNNWDFNVLGHLFEQETKISIRQAVLEWLAKPLGMQDFDPSHVVYDNDGEASQYRGWWIYMSARDLAKIGSLLLQKGFWDNKQILTKEWIQESTTAYSKTEYSYLEHYGYMWWIDGKTKVYAAVGVGNQVLIVDEQNNFCVSLRKDVGSSYSVAIRNRFFGREIPGKMMFSIYNILNHKEPFPDS